MNEGENKSVADVLIGKRRRPNIEVTNNEELTLPEDVSCEEDEPNGWR